MCTVLEEHGVSTARMVKGDMVDILKDFKTQKTRLEELVTQHGQICVFLPKFHCKLNFIECVCGQPISSLVLHQLLNILSVSANLLKSVLN